MASEACEAPMTEPSEASADATAQPQKEKVVLLFPDGAPPETAEAKAARLDELKAKHIQPIKREYLGLNRDSRKMQKPSEKFRNIFNFI